MKRSKEEHKIQCTIIKWRNDCLRANPPLKWLHAIPNGGARDDRTGAMLKREGVLRGIWDMFLPFPIPGIIGDDYHGLYIEVKKPASPSKKEGKLSPNQKEFGQWVRANGYATIVVYSAQSGINAISSYLQGEFQHGVRY